MRRRQPDELPHLCHLQCHRRHAVGAGVTLLGYWLGQIEFVRDNIEAILVLVVLVSVAAAGRRVPALARQGEKPAAASAAAPEAAASAWRAEALGHAEERAGRVGRGAGRERRANEPGPRATGPPPAPPPRARRRDGRRPSGGPDAGAAATPVARRRRPRASPSSPAARVTSAGRTACRTFVRLPVTERPGPRPPSTGPGEAGTPRRPCPRVLDLTLRIGELLLAGGEGAEDVEAAMLGVAYAYGLARVEPNVTFTLLGISYQPSLTDPP